MSCFNPGLFDPPGLSPQTVNAIDNSIAYVGGWTTEPGHQYRVSVTKDDTATFKWTGISVQVFGRVDPIHGMDARFAIDVEGANGGGTSCKQHGNSAPEDILLYDSATSPLPPVGQHTLLITNNGSPLSLHSLEVFGASKVATSKSLSEGASHTSQDSSPISKPLPQPTLPVTQLPGSTSSASHTASDGEGTNLPSTPLPLPLPGTSTVSARTSLSSPPQATTYSAIGGTAKSDAEDSPSYTVSSYTEVSTMDGSTITIVIQTTVAVPQIQPYHGPFRGAVAGVAIGGLLFILLLIGLGWWLWRRRRDRVRFLYGISNLDFDPTMMTVSSAELQSQSSGVRDSDATLYGGVLPQYKLPESYSSLALDLKKPLPSEYATSGISGDRRLTVYTEPSTRSPSVRSLCDKHSVSGPQSVEPVVPLSKDGIL